MTDGDGDVIMPGAIDPSDMIGLPVRMGGKVVGKVVRVDGETATFTLYGETMAAELPELAGNTQSVVDGIWENTKRAQRGISIGMSAPEPPSDGVKGDMD